MLTKNITVKLYPNKHMQQYLNAHCNYRRYCWNQALALWNDTYDMYKLNPQNNKCPTEYMIRNQLVQQKQDWQYNMSSRTLQLAINDLGNAMKRFINPKLKDCKHPKFKSSKLPKQGFKTDRAKIVNHKLRLDKARGYDKSIFYDIRMSKLGAKFNGTLKLVAIHRIRNQYFATLTFSNCDKQTTRYTNQKTGIDLNVAHLDYIGGQISILPKYLNKLYARVKHYQQLLARKRNANPHTYFNSINYVKTKTKLQQNYNRIKNIQTDILHKFTKYLVTNYDYIAIEDLDVKHMQMTHVASKGLHRALFGQFRQLLTYKCDWYGKHLIVASRYYASTQICSNCGYRKTSDEKITLQGNKKHHTNHDEFICYHCGYTDNRDHNAMLNLTALIKPVE